MLAKAEEGIQQKTPPDFQSALERVVQAGMTIMYSPKLAGQLRERIASVKDPAQDAGQGAARMVSNLYQQSGKKMPTEVIVPAGMIFAYEWLDLLSKAGKIEVTPDLIADTTQAVGDSILPLFQLPGGQGSLDKQKLAALIQQAKTQQGGAQVGGEEAAAPAAPAPAAPAPRGIIASAQGGA